MGSSSSRSSGKIASRQQMQVPVGETCISTKSLQLDLPETPGKHPPHPSSCSKIADPRLPIANSAYASVASTAVEPPVTTTPSVDEHPRILEIQKKPPFMFGIAEQHRTTASPPPSRFVLHRKRSSGQMDSLLTPEVCTPDETTYPNAFTTRRSSGSMNNSDHNGSSPRSKAKSSLSSFDSREGSVASIESATGRMPAPVVRSRFQHEAKRRLSAPTIVLVEHEVVFEALNFLTFPYRLTLLLRRKEETTLDAAGTRVGIRTSDSDASMEDPAGPLAISAVNTKRSSSRSCDSHLELPGEPAEDLLGERTVLKRTGHGVYYESAEFTILCTRSVVQFISIRCVDIVGIQVICGWHECVFDGTMLRAPGVRSHDRYSVAVKLCGMPPTTPSTPILPDISMIHPSCTGGGHDAFSTPTTDGPMIDPADDLEDHAIHMDRRRHRGAAVLFSMCDLQKPFVCCLSSGFRSIHGGDECQTISKQKSHEHTGMGINVC
eukprot:ANDGO_02952.mRNA.1 hypothetical protein